MRNKKRPKETSAFAELEAELIAVFEDFFLDWSQHIDKSIDTKKLAQARQVGIHAIREQIRKRAAGQEPAPPAPPGQSGKPEVWFCEDETALRLGAVMKFLQQDNYNE